MLLQSTIGKTALMIENEMFGDGHTRGKDGAGRVSSTCRAGGRRYRPAQWVAMASHRRRSVARRCGE